MKLLQALAALACDRHWRLEGLKCARWEGRGQAGERRTRRAARGQDRHDACPRSGPSTGHVVAAAPAPAAAQSRASPPCHPRPVSDVTQEQLE